MPDFATEKSQQLAIVKLIKEAADVNCRSAFSRAKEGGFCGIKGWRENGTQNWDLRYFRVYFAERIGEKVIVLVICKVQLADLKVYTR